MKIMDGAPNAAELLKFARNETPEQVNAVQPH
jgi:hypothetical protein